MVSFRLSTGCSDLSWLGMRLWKMFEHCLHSRGFANLIFDTLSHVFHIFSHLFTSFHMIHLSISIVPYSWGVLPLGSTFGMQLLACHCSLGPFVTKRKLPSNLLVESRYLASWIKYVLRSFGMFLMEEEWQDSITISSNVDRIVWLRRNSEYEMNKSLHNEFICKWVELDEINYLSLCYWQSVHGCLSFARRWTPGWLKRHWRCWEVALGRTSNQTTSCHLPAISLPHCNLLISP